MAIYTDKYRVNDKTGCWEWIGALGEDGYAALKKDGKRWRAARFFVEYYKNKIPLGYTVDHLCFNKKCVNPEHLEVVTQAENCRRRRVSKLDYNKVNRIRLLYKNGMTQIKLAFKFNVGQDHISRIVNDLSWDLAK